MNVPQVLVVYKKSFLEQVHRDVELLSRLESSTRVRLIRSDIENRRALQDVLQELARLPLKVDILWRGSIAARRRYDLVITVGGDGTFFAAAHSVRNSPILGVNSDPRTSLGLFTACDRVTFRRMLHAALKGKISRTRICRLKASINDHSVREFAVNDVLFSHRDPASMTRYILHVDGLREEQRSSGVWVSTAAGSTAGIRSAGGRRMPMTSRKMQYRVREPYTWSARYRLTHGTVERRLRITCLVQEAAIWIDGGRTRHDLRMGDVVTVEPTAPPLTLLGYNDRRRKQLFGKERS